MSLILDRRASCILPRYRTASREAREWIRQSNGATVADVLDRLCANLADLPDAGRTVAGSVLTTDDLDTLLAGITLLPCAVRDLVRTLGTLGWGEAEAEKALRQRVAGCRARRRSPRPDCGATRPARAAVAHGLDRPPRRVSPRGRDDEHQPRHRHGGDQRGS